MDDLRVEHVFPDRLDQIETDWALVFEPAHLVLRYAYAVQGYLKALVRNEHDAEEVAQEFFLWVSQNGLPRASQERGRFRDYLKKVVRNKALNFLRHKQPRSSDTDLMSVPAPDDGRGIPDQEWLVHWRRCVLQRAWRQLEDHQKRFPKGRHFTVLRLCATYPGEDSGHLAARVGSLEGITFTPDAFRKQVSRARRVFAELLVHEVAQTIDQPSPEDIEEELVDLGLMSYVRDYLPIRIWASNRDVTRIRSAVEKLFADRESQLRAGGVLMLDVIAWCPRLVFDTRIDAVTSPCLVFCSQSSRRGLDS